MIDGFTSIDVLHGFPRGFRFDVDQAVAQLARQMNEQLEDQLELMQRTSGLSIRELAERYTLCYDSSLHPHGDAVTLQWWLELRPRQPPG
jgi:hypothetical protein